MDTADKKKEKFKLKMQRFEQHSTVSRLEAIDVGWPLITGKWPFGKLTGASFVRNAPREVVFEPNDWIKLTRKQLVSCGAGADTDDAISEFIFERVMKTLLAYCNYMYDRGVEVGQRGITHKETYCLLERNTFLLYLTFRHFLPVPDSNVDAFSNQLARAFHEEYHGNEDMRVFYHSEDNMDLQRIRTEKMTRKVAQYAENDQVEAALGTYVTYISPNGFLCNYYACRFHEALGMPPLEVEYIAVLGFFARALLSEMVYITLKWCEEREKEGFPTLEDFKAALAENGDGDVLFHLPISFATPPPETRPARRARSPLCEFRPLVYSYYMKRQQYFTAKKNERLLMNVLRAEFYARHHPQQLRTVNPAWYRFQRQR